MGQNMLYELDTIHAERIWIFYGITDNERNAVVQALYILHLRRSEE